MASATRATRVMLPNAVTKSLHANSRCSLPFATLHPLALGSSVVISASESFFAGMTHSSGIGWRSLQPLCGAGDTAARMELIVQQVVLAKKTGHDLGNASSKNKRGQKHTYRDE